MNKLKAIEIFVEIADQGSMAAAARSLGVVNSVITKNLNELEGWLGRKLIFRSTRKMRLSKDGLEYLEECRHILESVHNLEAKGRKDEDIIYGEVKITAPIYLGQYVFAPLIAEYHKTFPEVSINLILSDDFKDMIDEGFDIAIRASQMPDSSFVSKRLQKASLVVVANNQYIEKHGAPSSPKDLRNHACLIEDDSDNRRRWRFKGKGEKQNSVSINGKIRVNYGGMIKAVCKKGLGIAQLPDFMVQNEIKNNELVRLLPDYELDNFFIHLLYHKRSTTNRAIKSVIDFIYGKYKN
ncbi:MAG: LysR family transcriptional regulator [Candidatus Thiodiazotropha sp. (ex Codakia rugifera)]|nr:LysR family transcriptional regulator [Candidatus Thiodiazotropha sp. (ex Codakia rugifera)]